MARRAGRRLRAGGDSLRDPYRPAALHRARAAARSSARPARRHGRRQRPAERPRGRPRARRTPGPRLPGSRASTTGRGDAGEVAGRLTAYLAGVQETLQAAEPGAGVEAEAAGGGGERARRKLQLGLAAAVLALTTVGGLSTAYYLRQRRARRGRCPDHSARPRPPRPGPRSSRRPARWHVGVGGDPTGRDAWATATPATPSPVGNWRTLRAARGAGLDGAEGRPPAARSPGRHPLPPAPTTSTAWPPTRPTTTPSRRRDRPGRGPAPGPGGGNDQCPPQATAGPSPWPLDDWADVRRRRARTWPGRIGCRTRPGGRTPTPGRRDLCSAMDQTDRAARLTALQAAAVGRNSTSGSAVSLDLLGTAL